MRRRTVLAALTGAIFAGCGGGGGAESSPVAGAGTASGAGPATASSSGGASAAGAAPPSAPAADRAPIALWGDSHVTGFARDPNAPGIAVKLRDLAPGREVFDGGVEGETSTQIANRQVLDTAHDDWVAVFWYGGNNQTQPDTIKADLARSIASLAPGNTRFVVVSVTNQAGEARGSANHQRILELNADLAAQYPLNFLDVRSHLVALRNPGRPQDVADAADDVIPSLRADGVHLNHAGAQAAASALLAFIASKGW